MVLKLYGSAMSTSRVLMTILEKELPYEYVFVDISKGEHKSEDFKKLQPFVKVPVLDDDGFIIFESRAICKYLARCVDWVKRSESASSFVTKHATLTHSTENIPPGQS